MTTKEFNYQSTIKQKKIISNILLALAYILLITFLTLAFNTIVFEAKLCFYTSSFLAFIFFIRKVKDLGTKINLLKNESDWQNKKYIGHNYNFETIKNNYEAIYKSDQNDQIDDYTWSDLNLDEFYTKTAFLLTTPGEIALYSFLRTPIFEQERLINRDKLIEELRHSDSTRGMVIELLTAIGKDSSDSVVDLLFKEVNYPQIWKYISRLMFFTSMSAFAMFIINVKIAVLMLVACSLAGSYLHSKMQTDLLVNFEALVFFRKMLKTVNNKIKKINKHEMLRTRAAEINLESGVIYLKKTFFLILPGFDKSSILFVVYEYLNMLFLLQENAFFTGHQHITKNKKDFEKYFKSIGELDAILSIAKLKNSLAYHCTPALNDDNLNLKFTELYHPLLDRPVANDLGLDRHGILITGSNMAGKSTFLRTIGINVLLSQTFFFACAKSFRCNFMHIISSVSLTDNLLTGKSYYYMEAERIKKVIQISQSGFKSLCLIDEMLKGTNSRERIIAAHGIFKYLLKQNSIIFAATHDIELAYKLDSEFDNYHFTDNITEHELCFDFKIKNGISQTTNAIKLLKYFDYPDEIFI